MWGTVGRGEIKWGGMGWGKVGCEWVGAGVGWEGGWGG
jgi:hypothetical protein